MATYATETEETSGMIYLTCGNCGGIIIDNLGIWVCNRCQDANCIGADGVVFDIEEPKDMYKEREAF